MRVVDINRRRVRFGGQRINQIIGTRARHVRGERHRHQDVQGLALDHNPAALRLPILHRRDGPRGRQLHGHGRRIARHPGQVVSAPRHREGQVAADVAVEQGAFERLLRRGRVGRYGEDLRGRIEVVRGLGDGQVYIQRRPGPVRADHPELGVRDPGRRIGVQRLNGHPRHQAGVGHGPGRKCGGVVAGGVLNHVAAARFRVRHRHRAIVVRDRRVQRQRHRAAGHAYDSPLGQIDLPPLNETSN